MSGTFVISLPLCLFSVCYVTFTYLCTISLAHTTHPLGSFSSWVLQRGLQLTHVLHDLPRRSLSGHQQEEVPSSCKGQFKWFSSFWLGFKWGKGFGHGVNAVLESCFPLLHSCGSQRREILTLWLSSLPYMVATKRKSLFNFSIQLIGFEIEYTVCLWAL